jgi:Ca2+-binding EF-hand superfamily protein
LCCQVIAGCLSEEEIKGLKEMFKNIDKDNSGTITLEELKNGLAKQGTKLSDNEIEQLMEAVSLCSSESNQEHVSIAWLIFRRITCISNIYRLMQMAMG